MYPPRKNGDSRSKNGSGSSGYVSPSQKDTAKVNKIIEQAKKYDTGSSGYKRDYMLEGIMSIKKK